MERSKESALEGMDETGFVVYLAKNEIVRPLIEATYEIIKGGF